MQAIPTTQTAVRKIKQAARRIQREQAVPLATALDLAAKAAGYTDFHHVTWCASKSAKPSLRFSVFPNIGPGPRQGDFYPGTDLAHATDQLDQLLEQLNFFGFEDMAPRDLAQIIRLCRQLTTQYPAFLDGHAHLLGALCELGQPGAALPVAQQAFDAAAALIPADFSGVIHPQRLDNRPFYRLAHNLSHAYNVEGRDQEAPPSLAAAQRYAGAPA